MIATMRKNRGFSLIELMIAVAIFAILATLAVPAYRDLINNNQIRNAAESIQTGIQLARAEAVKRNASVRLSLNGTDSSWTVGCPTVTANCPATIQSRSVSEGSSSSISVASTDSVAAGPYVFNSLGVKTSPAPTAANGFVGLDITHSASGTRPLRVVIAIGGSSRMCDPSTSLSTTDPRKCP